MSKISQRQAVFTATMNVLADKGISFDEGQTPTAQELVTKDMRKSIMEVVTNGIQNGEVEFSDDARAKHTTVEKVRTYVSGLINNWFRKDKRLNGGAKYESKNPGSRAGSTDEQIKALKTLRKAKSDDADAVKAIDEAIATRQAEIAATKVKRVEVTQEQLDAIPAELRSRLGL